MMTSKRNSRVYVDEEKHSSDNQSKPVPTSYRSRRNSRNSTKDEKMLIAEEAEHEIQLEQFIRESGPQSSFSGSLTSGKDSPVSSQSDTADSLSTSTSIGVSDNGRTADAPAPVSNGRPDNFGLIVPGVYRSSYPRPEDYAFLQKLNLKTVVTLAKKDELDDGLQRFIDANGTCQIVFNMKGTKKESIPVDTMKAILHVVLDYRNYPLLLHCNQGKHRTGCVAAVMRKLAGWNLDDVLDEYRTYAAPKIRECDVDYISDFQPPQDWADDRALQFSASQLRTFFRALLFSTFVMVLWLVSGSQMPRQDDTLARSWEV